MQIKRFLDHDWDYVLAISGDAGVGKSSLTGELAKEVDPYFTFRRNNFYSRREMRKAIWNYPTKSFINADEAINMLYRRDYYEQKQKQLLKDLDMIRDRNEAMSFLAPDFWSLDSKILNSRRIKIWIFCERRGVGYIFRHDKKQFNKAPWNVNLNMKLLKNWMYGVHPRGSPNYVDTSKWDPLPPDEYAEYKKVKDEKKLAASQEAEDEEEEGNVKLNKQRNELIRLLAETGSLSQKEIAEKLNLTAKTISLAVNKKI